MTSKIAAASASLAGLSLLGLAGTFLGEPGDTQTTAPVARLDSSESEFLRLAARGVVDSRPSGDLIKIGVAVCDGLDSGLSPWTLANSSPSGLTDVPVYDSYDANRIGDTILSAATQTLCPKYAGLISKGYA